MDLATLTAHPAAHARRARSKPPCPTTRSFAAPSSSSRGAGASSHRWSGSLAMSAEAARLAAPVHPLGRPVAEGLRPGADPRSCPLAARRFGLGLDATYEVGLSGPGRLHDLFVTHEAMTPGDYKARGEGIDIRYGFHASPFGNALVMTTEHGLAGLAFADPGGRRRRSPT